MYADSRALGAAESRTGRSRTTTAIIASPCRTGNTSRETGPLPSPGYSRPETERSSSQARRSNIDDGRETRRATWSSECTVGPVVGRTWATQTKAPGSVGTHTDMSENDRSDSSCHSEASR